MMGKKLHGGKSKEPERIAERGGMKKGERIVGLKRK